MRQSTRLSTVVLKTSKNKATMDRLPYVLTQANSKGRMA